MISSQLFFHINLLKLFFQQVDYFERLVEYFDLVGPVDYFECLVKHFDPVVPVDYFE